MNDSSVKQWVAVVVLLMSCGGEPEGNTGGGNGATGGGGGGSASTVKASDCTLSATIEKVGSSGGRAAGSLTCPASAELEISVCIQSSMTMSFTNGPCSAAQGTNSVITRGAEAGFAGARNVRAFVRGRVNGVDLADMPSTVIFVMP